MIYERFNISHKQLKSDFNVVFVVRECNVKYHKSANFEDHLEVHTLVSKKTPVRLKLIQEVKRGEETLVTAEVELAVTGSNGSITKLPRNLLDKI